MAKNPTMNFQAYLEGTFRIIKAEPLVIIGGGFLLQLLFIASQGLASIIAGPLLGGYLLAIILYLRENRRPRFNDLFVGFKQFGHLFPYFLVLLIILIGFALLILPGILFATWWIYVLPLMVDRKMSFSEAMRLSMNTVNEKGFFMHLVFLLLITLIPVILLNILAAVMPVFIIMSVLLPPFQAGCLAGLYIDQFTTEKPAAASSEVSLLELQGAEEKTAGAEPGENPAEEKSESTGDAGETPTDAAQEEEGDDTEKQEKN